MTAVWDRPSAGVDVGGAQFRVTTDLEVVRVSLAYVRELVDITRGDREPLDAMIFTAVLDANMTLVERDASLHGAYGGAMASAPDALRRPVSINAVAQSLDLPFETVRRRVLKMARRDLCVIGPGGVVVPNRAVTSAAYAAEQRARFDLTRVFHRTLARLGAVPAGTVRASLSSSGPPVRAVNWAVSAYALRTSGGLVGLAGNVVACLVLVELALANVGALPGPALTRWAGDPGRFGVPIKIAALSERVRLPVETVRRHMHALAAAGFCIRRPDGFVVAVPAMARRVLARLADANKVHLRRLFGRLDQLGVLAAWATEAGEAGVSSMSRPPGLLKPLAGRLVDAPHPLQRALQDPGGGHLVDDLGAPLAVDVVLFDQHPGHGRRRQALVPEGDRQVRLQAQQVAAQGAVGLAADALGAVHVHRQADDDAGGLAAAHQLEQHLGVLAELGLLDQGQRAGDGQGDVGHGHADGLLARVQTHDGEVIGDGGGEFGDIENGHSACFPAREC
jgi:hypothetical protein